MILILIIVAAMITATLSACGDDEAASGGSVAATTGILADLTAAITGDDLEVVQIVPDTASPHDFQPSAEDRQRMAEADLVVVNGAGLDTAIPVDEVDAAVWELAENTPDPLAFAEHAEEDDHAQDTDGAQDPHVWMDPTRVAAALPSLADALGDADPDNAAGYRERARDLADRLEKLDREIAAELEAVPPADRELVTSHDALAYFADRYGFEVVATAFPATGADAEPSAGALAEVIDAVEATGAPALFAEETDDPEALESVAAETGAAVVDALLVETPGSAGTYEEMLRQDAELIANALGG
jgi:zinc/manganese transport system substrate-binding protein